jgi:hypothetical protein
VHGVTWPEFPLTDDMVVEPGLETVRLVGPANAAFSLGVFGGSGLGPRMPASPTEIVRLKAADCGRIQLTHPAAL